jgi:prolyl-tRNA editing enzyme YbaK/EbsC (Cys-tRNA(Pro) deacylase)
VVGCVPPFAGVLSRIPVFFDESILQNELVDFSVGLHTHSVEMKSADLCSLAKPVMGTFSVLPVVHA